MYPLLKILNTDLIKEIYHYNNYSKLDMEWFRHQHRATYLKVMIELDHYFLRPLLRKAWLNHIVNNVLESYNYEYIRDGGIIVS